MTPVDEGVRRIAATAPAICCTTSGDKLPMGSNVEVGVKDGVDTTTSGTTSFDGIGSMPSAITKDTDDSGRASNVVLSVRREGRDGVVEVRSGSTGRRGHEMVDGSPVKGRGVQPHDCRLYCPRASMIMLDEPHMESE